MGQAGMQLACGESVQALEIIGPVREARFRAFERDLRQASFLHRSVTPAYNALLFKLFHRGNERAIPGDDDWLFYGEDLDYLTRHEHHAERAARTVIDFRDQLASREIELLLVLVDPKSAWEGRYFADYAGSRGRLEPPARKIFTQDLGAAGVPFVDLGELTVEYLPRDTHWTPDTMLAVADLTAQRALTLLGSSPEPQIGWETTPVIVRGAGDLVRMLHWPAEFAPFPVMEMRTEIVENEVSGELFRADRSAEVLLLGDSFTRVFSDEELGLGSGAGFDAHLARALGAGLDVIASPGGSARAVRESLARRSEGTSGKRLVIWQLSLRDLAADARRWQPIELGTGSGVPSPARQGDLVVEAEIVETTTIPVGFDYRRLLAVSEYRVLRTLEGEAPSGPLWVAHLVIREYEEIEAARFPVGARHRMTLGPIDDHYDLERTSWVDHTDAGFEIWFARRVEALD